MLSLTLPILTVALPLASIPVLIEAAIPAASSPSSNGRRTLNQTRGCPALSFARAKVFRTLSPRMSWEVRWTTWPISVS